MKSFEKHKEDQTTGFGKSGESYGGRYYRRDGRINIIKKGVGLFESQSWFHTMLTMSTWKFIFVLFASYILINTFFAFIYMAIGIESLAGANDQGLWKDFTQAFFFSADTFTTVGYGFVSPGNATASAVAAFEAFVGLLGFAIASGLFYARFSKPQAFIRFSKNALISPYKNGEALMIQLVSYKNNHLTNAEASVIAALRINENGKLKNLFFQLPLEVDKINALAMNWTLVHFMDEKSPLHGFSIDDFKSHKIEIIVHITAFDESFAKTVVARTSYTGDELMFNASFKDMYHPDKHTNATILNVDKLNDIDQVK